MVYVEVDDGPVRLPGCAPLYHMPQTKWTPKLFWQMAAYVTWIVSSMVIGGLMPFLLDARAARQVEEAWQANVASLPASNYTFCPKKAVYNYMPLARGYPAPPLAVNGSDLVDTWSWRKVTLRGVNWFGFNNEGGMVDGLWVGGTRGDTDFHALAYQIKLLGFNAVRLPFTFSQLKLPGKRQAMECAASTKSAWARRATDPTLSPKPEYSVAPDPPLFMEVAEWDRDMCNTYVPSNETALAGERLLWAVQYFIASGFYVVLDYHPLPSDPLPADPKKFAYAWLNTWASITCLPNFAPDIRGRVLLDLLNEPDTTLRGRGVHWQRAGDTPGLDELYLTTMDAIEALTPGDALFMVQGSTATGAEAEGGMRNVNGFNLSTGDGFVTDAATISANGLSDPSPFLNELLLRAYSTRTLLAPHLYPASISTRLVGAVPAGGKELFDKLAASWGRLARVGYCLGPRCQRFPVIIGEMGSELATKDDLKYYVDAASFATAQGDLAQQTAPVAGWFWWSFNANSMDTGGLVAKSGHSYNWVKLRLLASSFGLKPWFNDPQAFVADQAASQAEAKSIQDAQASAALAAAQRKAKEEAVADVSADGGAVPRVSSISDIIIQYKPLMQAALAATMATNTTAMTGTARPAIVAPAAGTTVAALATGAAGTAGTARTAGTAGTAETEGTTGTAGTAGTAITTTAVEDSAPVGAVTLAAVAATPVPEATRASATTPVAAPAVAPIAASPIPTSAGSFASPYVGAASPVDVLVAALVAAPEAVAAAAAPSDVAAAAAPLDAAAAAAPTAASATATPKATAPEALEATQDSANVAGATASVTVGISPTAPDTAAALPIADAAPAFVGEASASERIQVAGVAAEQK